jgi:hypothetical protein
MHLTHRSLKPLNEERCSAEHEGNSYLIPSMLIAVLLYSILYMNLMVIQMFYFIVSLLDHNQAQVSM